MVTQIKAYQAEDGKVFASQDEALRHDAYNQLMALGIFNHATTVAVLDNMDAVLRALGPVAAYIFPASDAQG